MPQPWELDWSAKAPPDAPAPDMPAPDVPAAKPWEREWSAADAEAAAPAPATFDEALAAAPQRTVEPTPYQIGTAAKYGMPAPQATQETVVEPGSGGFTPALKAGFVGDEAWKLRLIAKSLFPDDPDAASRVGMVNGQPAYVNKEGKLENVSGPYARFFGETMAHSPEIALGTIGAFSPFPIAGSTLGVMTGRAVEKGIGNLVFDEPQTALGNAADIATAGATNLAFGAGGKAVTAGLAARKAAVTGTERLASSTGMTEAKLAESVAIKKRIKAATGIDLDLAQASGDRRLIQMRNYAARFPGKASELIQAEDEIAKGQLDEAMNRILNLVGESGTPVQTAGMKGANAADMALTMTRRGVSAEVDPFYEAAYEQTGPIIDPTINALLKRPYISDAYDAAQKEVGEHVSNVRRNSVSDVLEKQGRVSPDLRALDRTKQKLDKMYQDAAGSGARGTAASIAQARDDLVTHLDGMAKNNGAYEVARARYAQLHAERIAPLEDGIVGMLAKIDDPQAAKAAAQIFQSPKNIDEHAMTIARNAFMGVEGGEKAWNGLVRQWMAGITDDAMTVTQAGQEFNPAGKIFKALAGSPERQKQVLAALGPEARTALNETMEAAQKLARTPIRGSDTESNRQLSELMQNSKFAFIYHMIRSPTGALTHVAMKKADKMYMQQMVNGLATELTNPEGVAALRAAAREKNPERQAARYAALLSGMGVLTYEPSKDTGQ